MNLSRPTFDPGYSQADFFDCSFVGSCLYDISDGKLILKYNKKKPVMTSFTKLWAPKPMASPTTPAPASTGPKFTLN